MAWLHIIDYPPELENTFLKITHMFSVKSGPFALIEQEGRNTADFYANCFNDVRMAICATWYNMHTFENLCRELEERVEEITKTHAIKSQLQMNISGSAQKLCFEYEHFMFHQRTTVDRIAFFLSGFFKKGQEQDNILKVRKHVVRQCTKRLDDPKQIYALAIDAVVNKHQSFLNSIHGTTRGQTERDILSHKSFIPFVNPYVQITPPGKASVVFQATFDGKRIAPESARAILLQRYNQVAEFTKDMLDTFFDA
jgi:hypothetical protein